jgi:hypothetical protein
VSFGLSYLLIHFISTGVAGNSIGLLVGLLITIVLADDSDRELPLGMGALMLIVGPSSGRMCVFNV